MSQVANLYRTCTGGPASRRVSSLFSRLLKIELTYSRPPSLPADRVSQHAPPPPTQRAETHLPIRTICSRTTGPPLTEVLIRTPTWQLPKPMPIPGNRSENDESLSNNEKLNLNDERGNKDERLKWRMWKLGDRRKLPKRLKGGDRPSCRQRILPLSPRNLNSISKRKNRESWSRSRLLFSVPTTWSTPAGYAVVHGSAGEADFVAYQPRARESDRESQSSR